MDSLIILVFFALLIGEAIYLAKYSRVLQSIVDCSNMHKVDIFGTYYKNVYHLMSDISFINRLWVKGCQHEISDSQLSLLVGKASHMLRAQTWLALLFFTGLLVFGFLNANG